MTHMTYELLRSWHSPCITTNLPRYAYDLPDLTPRTYGLYYVKLAQFLQDNLLLDTNPNNSICLIQENLF